MMKKRAKNRNLTVGEDVAIKLGFVHSHGGRERMNHKEWASIKELSNNAAIPFLWVYTQKNVMFVWDK